MNELPDNSQEAPEKNTDTPTRIKQLTLCIISVKEVVSSRITSLLIDPLDKRLETYVKTCDELCDILNDPKTPAIIKQQLSSLRTTLLILYTLESQIISTIIHQKEWIIQKDMHLLRAIWFHIQTLTSLLQNLKISYKWLWAITNVIWDLIAYTPYPYSYLMWKDVLSYRIINRTQIPEICMLMASVWAFATYYFTFSWNAPEALFVMAHNKAMFTLSQFTKEWNIPQFIMYTKALLHNLLANSPKNSHSWDDLDA